MFISSNSTQSDLRVPKSVVNLERLKMHKEHLRFIWIFSPILNVLYCLLYWLKIYFPTKTSNLCLDRRIYSCLFLPQPNSTQPRVGLALFSYGNHDHTTNHKPYPTLSQLLHNQTRPNSVYNLISTKLEDSCQKKLAQPRPPLPKKN